MKAADSRDDRQFQGAARGISNVASRSVETGTGAARAAGAVALGALAVGALAFGALAVGALAVGRLAIGRARIRHLEIENLVVRNLRVTGDIRTASEPHHGSGGKE